MCITLFSIVAVHWVKTVKLLNKLFQAGYTDEKSVTAMSIDDIFQIFQIIGDSRIAITGAFFRFIDSLVEMNRRRLIRPGRTPPRPSDRPGPDSFLT